MDDVFDIRLRFHYGNERVFIGRRIRQARDCFLCLFFSLRLIFGAWGGQIVYLLHRVNAYPSFPFFLACRCQVDKWLLPDCSYNTYSFAYTTRDRKTRLPVDISIII